MTTTRSREQRFVLPLAQWPAADRVAWKAAIRGGDPFDEQGPAARWRPATKAKVATDYGAWLGFLSRQGILAPDADPAGRVTPERIASYVAMLRSRCRNTTVEMRIRGLVEALRVMAPTADWSSLRRVLGRLHKFATDGRDKRSRIQSSRRLFDLGLELMEEAEAEVGKRPLLGTVRYRDGLAIALLAARPFRIATFATIRLGQNLDRIGDGYRLRFAANEIKAGPPVEVPVPEALTTPIDRYVTVYRPRLLGPCADTGFFWVTRDGEPMRPNVFRKQVAKWTACRLGTRLSPHLFRDSAATSIAVEDPEHFQIAKLVLGHSSLATTNKHYNQARMLESSRRYQEAILRLRQTGPRTEDLP